MTNWFRRAATGDVVRLVGVRLTYGAATEPAERQVNLELLTAGTSARQAAQDADALTVRLALDPRVSADAVIQRLCAVVAGLNDELNPAATAD